MPRPMYRSRSLRRRGVRLPGGRMAVHYEGRGPGKARCALCGGALHGVPILRPSKLKKLPKTRRRPERPYGGVLCSSCVMELLKQEARNESWPSP